MGKKLAIKGHPTRGNEVIELLEMMGGYKDSLLKDDDIYDDNYFYFILAEENNAIDGYPLKYKDKVDEDYVIFTLEEFWEKYPIKIGDEVTDLKTDKIAEVYKMHWSENNSCVYYDIKYPNNHGCQRRLMDLKPTNDVDDVHSISECKTIGQGTYAIRIANGYKFDSIDENGNIIVKSINPKYPKTYVECCEFLGKTKAYQSVSGYKTELLEDFQKIFICRDAYWKIAGEQMGLDKPWEPDNDTEIYNIYRTKNIIRLGGACWGGNCNILEFPTEEMRDAFYENFKDLIEQCKELL